MERWEKHRERDGERGIRKTERREMGKGESGRLREKGGKQNDRGGVKREKPTGALKY